jgi:hypothetical protein
MHNKDDNNQIHEQSWMSQRVVTKGWHIDLHQNKTTRQEEKGMGVGEHLA